MVEHPHASTVEVIEVDAIAQTIENNTDHLDWIRVRYA